MTAAAALAGCLLVVVGIWRWGPERVVLQLAGVLLALFLGALVMASVSISARPSAPTLVNGLGSLELTRLTALLVLGALAALAAQLLVAGPAGPRSGAVALLVGLGFPAAIALTSDSLVVVAVAVLALMGSVWLRWQRIAGPQLHVRSMARQVVMVFAALLGAEAVLPSVRLGEGPPVLVAILLSGAVAGLMSVLPFSGWTGAATRLDHPESAFWRLWMVPAGVLLEARLIAECPPSVATPMRELLIGLGLATAFFWGARALVGPTAGRYARTFASDVGLMCVGVAIGTPLGLAAALLLILVHWLGGAVLGEESAGRSQLLGWIGVSGIPPFGGFTGRILVVIAASSVSPTLAVLVLLALGLQLGGAAVGMRATVASRIAPAAGHLELVGLGVALTTLVLGVVPMQVLQLVMGVRP